jgi:hypothetical protein
MPQLDGSQMRIGGEILDSVSLNTNTQSIVEIGNSYVDLDRDLVVSFKSDRTGQVEVYCSFYLEKTTSNSTGELRLRLVDSSDTLIIGTLKDCVRFHEGIGSSMVNFSWILDVSNGTSYTFKPQISRISSSETFKLVFGGISPSMFLKVIGL